METQIVTNIDWVAVIAVIAIVICVVAGVMQVLDQKHNPEKYTNDGDW